jgi:hypothetical protein
MSKRKLILIASLVSVCGTLLILGCAGTSLSTNPAPDSGQTVSGMPYFLPIGKITIKGEYAKSEAESTQNKDSETSTAASAVDAVAAGGSTAPTPTPKAPKSPSDDNNSPGAGSANSVTISAQWTISITAEVEADPSAVRYAVPGRNYIFDDETHITVNSRHLLSVGNATAEDRTADIVGAVASMVSKVMIQGVTQPSVSRNPFYFSFHPSNVTETINVTKQLGKRGITLVVGGPTWDSKNPAGPSTLEGRGLAFRLAAPYTVTLKYAKDDDEVINSTHQFLLPDNPVYVLDYSRMPFVKKVTEVGFTDGMLTDYHQTLPSPVLGFLGIPKAILSAVVPLPSSGGTGSKAGAGKSG